MGKTKKGLLNSKNKSEKNADFKRRKSQLGRGKHQHLSHTKIDLQTATIKVPTQAKFDTEEVETPGPTLQQLQDILTLCHSENDRKVLSGLSALLQFLPRATDIFLQQISPIISATLHHLRHNDPKIRELTRNLVSWLFSRHAPACSPFIPVFLRHVSAAVSSPSQDVKLQSAYLLEKIILLPNLKPIPSLFSVFPQMIKAATTPQHLSTYARAITQVLQRFSIKTKEFAFHNPKEFCFPLLFQYDTPTYSLRYTPNCSIGTDEQDSVKILLYALSDSLQLVRGDSKGNTLADVSSLLLSIHNILPTLDLTQFLEFASERFPAEDATLKKNIAIAKFIELDTNNYHKIKKFINGTEMTIENITLFANVGYKDFDGSLVGECIQELCDANISEESAPSIANAFLEYIEQNEKITKKTLRTLISLKKDNDFQINLLPVLEAKLPISPPSIVDLLLVLVSSTAPLSREFLKSFVDLLCAEAINDELCVKCIEAVSTTEGLTDHSRILSFLMSIGKRKESLRDIIRRHIRRLELLSFPEEKQMFTRINTNEWIIV